MGLKGYRLWAMGEIDSTCRAPPPLAPVAGRPRLIPPREGGSTDDGVPGPVGGAEEAPVL
jgi:hypothetical protein